MTIRQRCIIALEDLKPKFDVFNTDKSGDDGIVLTFHVES